MMKSEKKNYTGPFVAVTGLFFMWGFITCMNDILIPYLKEVFVLNYFRSMLVQFSFFGAYFIGSVIYFIISVRSGDPINRIGYRNGIIAGLLISATGTALFYPAAEMESYGFFLAALFVLGLGFTLLQIAANPYVAILGSETTASARLNLAQGFNSFGTTIAPLVGGFLIFEYFVGPEFSGAQSVKVPYLIFSGLFLVLALIIRIAHLPRFFGKEDIERNAGALKYPHLVLGMIAIFLYVGGEVSIGSFMISYLELESIAGLDKSAASEYVAFYWGGLMIGRFMGAISLSGLPNGKKNLIMLALAIVAFLVIMYLKGVSIAFIYGLFLITGLAGFFVGKSLAGRTLMIFSLINVVLITIAITSSHAVAMWTIIGVGFFNSIMWSNIFTLAIAGLGKYTSQGSSLLVMMILGGAIIPVVQGGTADAIGVHASFIVPLFSYLYIAFYGWKGHVRKEVLQ